MKVGPLAGLIPANPDWNEERFSTGVIVSLQPEEAKKGDPNK